MDQLTPDVFETRTVDLCAGPGGWDQGAKMLDLDLGITGFDVSKDAVATARAAGHTRVHADVLALHPSQFISATGLIASAPCPTFSDGGLRTGRGSDYQQVLDVWTSIGWGIDAAEALADLNVQDPRTALLATVGVWALSMENLEWIAMEQVPAVEFAWEDLAAELYGADWDWVDVRTLCASDFGVPSRRRRTFLLARRYSPPPVSMPYRAGTPTSMAAALGWDPGHRVITRGNRRPTGGNGFSADGPSWCLTGSARSWEREDGVRLTPAQAGVLTGFDQSYPWAGSRTSAFLQASDVVSPVVAAHALATVSTRWASEMPSAMAA